MPITFTKEEVKEFLEQQGFDVSEERTLKNFIHDLKKLIKYEDMQRRRKKLGHLPDETVLDSTDGRIPYTSSSTQQETSSPYDDDSNENDENSRSQFQKSIGQAPRAPTRKSPEKKREIPRSPVRQQRPYTKKEPAGDTPLTGSYGSDETTSYEHEDSPRQRPPVSATKLGGKESAQKQQQRPPPTFQRPLSENAMRSQPIISVPPKKKGNRLIMKRITASQDINGDSIIEESDVDLGPVRRPYQYQPPPQKKKPPVFARPKTAPSKQEAGASKPSRSEPVSRPMSSKSLNNNNGKQPQDKDVCDPEEIDTDELFQAISELILPTGRLDSDGSSVDEDECRTKHLLKPPPHVARDPVLLYHWYKTYNWDLYTIPGEDRHMKLRWNVRAKTVGGYHPCVEVRKIAKPQGTRNLMVPPKLCRYKD